MKTLFQTIVMVQLASGENHAEDIYTDAPMDLDPLKRAIESVGAKFAYQSKAIVMPESIDEAMKTVEDWALGHVEPSPPLAAPAPPIEFQRLNEIERTQTNQGRQLSEISTAITQLTKLVTVLAQPQPRTSSEANEQTEQAWQPVPAQPPKVAGTDRRSARQKLAEFKGSDVGDQEGYKGNSMDIQTGASASPMPGMSTLHGGTGIVAVTGFDSNGQPIVGDLPPMTVGDSFKRGNLAG